MANQPAPTAPTVSQAWRENAPLYGVGVVLLLAFALLAIFGRTDVPGSSADQSALAAGQAGAGATPAPLGALPGNADDKLVVTSALSPDEARARNLAVAFDPTGPGKAAPFDFRGSSLDRERARDCLALAAMAEAGGGDADQRAVIQVILNRVRHPAFAKTVCGVVYEGSDRPTGCQFTFTCDGSLARTYSDGAWAAARRRAEEALGGYVDKVVGVATHYHTDWVYPWWSSQLDKIAKVNTHLFFRWDGFWGSAKALSARYAGGEPDPAPLAEVAQIVAEANPLPLFSENGAAVRTITAADTSPVAPGLGDAAAPAASAPAPGSPAPGVHFVLVSASDAPASLVERARALCPGQSYCQVYGWDDAAAMPERLPLTGDARRMLRFSFLAGRNGDAEAVYFDCRTYPSPSLGNCLPRARP